MSGGRRVLALLPLLAGGCETPTPELPAATPTIQPLLTQGTRVQSGLVTSTAAGSVTATLEAVDPSRAFLLFTSRSDSDRPVGTTLRGRLAGPSTVEFVRVTDELVPATISIRWFVVEYASGVRVQRGDAPQAASTVDIPITPVVPEQAFVTFSKSCQADDDGWNDDDAVVVKLTAANNVQVRVATGTPAHVISWQVVEFTDPTWIRVQRGSAALVAGTLTTDATLSAPADPARTFVLASFRSGADGADVGARLITAELISPTTIRFRRDAGGSPDDLPEIHWQAVELGDGSVVQRGTTTLAAGVNVATEPLALIDEARSVAILSTESGAGQAMGRSPMVLDDVAGVALAQTQLAGDLLTLRRQNAAAAATFAWSVIQFGPTCGNGLLEGDEPCDGTVCCQAGCVAGNAGAPCREAAGVCDEEETCDGVSGQCPADGFLSGVECHPAGGQCDPAEVCSGDSPTCPLDTGPGTCGGPGGGGSGGGDDSPYDDPGAAGDETTSALACHVPPAGGRRSGASAPFASPLFALAALALAGTLALRSRRRATIAGAEGCRSPSDSNGRDPGPVAPIRSSTRSSASPSPSPSETPSAPRE